VGPVQVAGALGKSTMLAALATASIAWNAAALGVRSSHNFPSVWGQPARSLSRGSSRMMLSIDEEIDFATLGETGDTEPVGVLLLSVGAPETPDDVEEYLYNVFCDPEILTLPPAISWLFKRPLAWFIAKSRARDAKEAMKSIGGVSPQLQTIQAQAEAMKDALADRGIDGRVYIATRYWHPFAEEAVKQIVADGLNKLVIVPLYPQFSLSTSGSALRVLERMLYSEPGFPAKSSVVPAWYNRPGYLSAMCELIIQSMRTLPEGAVARAHILFTAQGLPRKYVDDLGDPYEEQIERSVALLHEALSAQGFSNNHSLAYQGQFGPERLRWIGPAADDEIRRLARQGVEEVVMVPISYVFEHMGTLNEMDREFASLARSCGITSFVRVPTLGTNPAFIGALATVVAEALPDLSRPSMQQINAGNPVSLNMVNEYTRLYTKDQLQLVPQEQPWGFTEQAEVVNGRLAMAAITVSIALSADPTLKAVVAMYRAARGMDPA